MASRSEPWLGDPRELASIRELDRDDELPVVRRLTIAMSVALEVVAELRESERQRAPEIDSLPGSTRRR
jgi:hypothetical protein